LLYITGNQYLYSPIYAVFTFRNGGDPQQLENMDYGMMLSQPVEEKAILSLPESSYYQPYRPGGDIDTTQSM